MTESPNYCQHPECHNSRIAYYSEYYATSAQGTQGVIPQVVQVASFARRPEARRWCKSHAFINERWAIG